LAVPPDHQIEVLHVVVANLLYFHAKILSFGSETFDEPCHQWKVLVHQENVVTETEPHRNFVGDEALWSGNATFTSDVKSAVGDVSTLWQSHARAFLYRVYCGFPQRGSKNIVHGNVLVDEKHLQNGLDDFTLPARACVVVSP